MSIVSWIDRNIFSLAREMRISYLPPLMVYVAAGVSTLTSIVGTFFVKEYLGLSAEFLATLGFWMGFPYVLKMPLGHLVDLLWRHKAHMLYLGAALIAVSLTIMFALIAHTHAMRALLPIETWYVIAALVAPMGYVLQDVVADAMTVEAVPRLDASGMPIADVERKLMHTTMQTLGRVAVIGGSLLVAVVNLAMFRDVNALSAGAKADVYAQIYVIALLIPAVSVAGVMLHGLVLSKRTRRLHALGLGSEQLARLGHDGNGLAEPNWWVLGGSLSFVVFSLGIGLSQHRYAAEIVFAGCMVIVLFLIARLTSALDPDVRSKVIATLLVVFALRAVPSPGEGLNWWMIDELKFDQSFFALLSMIGAVITLVGMFIFRRFMAERSIAYIVGALTVVSTAISLPILAMYHGLHHWSADVTAGVVDARFIAVMNTAFESPLPQIAMIPVLAWIAHSAPDALKATYFAVMASFLNLALSAAQLGTKYLNGIFTVTREVRDVATARLTVAADYSELGDLLVAVLLIGFALPMAAIVFVKLVRLRGA